MPGMQELMVIVVVALLVFGPDRLPEIARTVGKTIARLRGETQRNVAELRRLADLDELEAELREARAALRDVSRQAGLAGTEPSGPRLTMARESAADSSPQVRGDDAPPPFDMEAT